jgi:hypothetical protein
VGGRNMKEINAYKNYFTSVHYVSFIIILYDMYSLPFGLSNSFGNS